MLMTCSGLPAKCLRSSGLSSYATGQVLSEQTRIITHQLKPGKTAMNILQLQGVLQ